MSDTAEKQCQRCGKPLSPEVLGGVCPVCMLTVGASAVGEEKTGSFKPPAPAELSRYFPALEVIELLGRGGMGAVYRARQKQLDRMVALKILPPGIGNDPAFAERFTREARALAKLNHPNIVALHEFGQTDGLFFFIMEFVDGVTLGQLLAAGRITPKEALAIVPQICDALQYAHFRGIVHRDIKPQNILLSKEGQVKIADFGVAKLVACETGEPAPDSSLRTSSGLTRADRAIGTPAYMAPEQTIQPFEVDHRADIYSLGVVFYQMLTGELPTGNFEPPSRKVYVDVRLDEVVLRPLEKQPQRRYAQVEELKTQLETIAATLADSHSSESQVQTEPIPNVVSRPSQRKGIMKTRYLITTVVAVALIAAFALFLISRNKPHNPQEVTQKEIAETSIEEWFARIGEQEAKLGLPRFSSMNALIQKAKENEDARDKIIRLATGIIDNPQEAVLRRWQSCYVLSGTGDKRAIPTITRALKDENDTIRGVAACALGAFIDEADARSALEEASKGEKTQNVQKYIQEALSGKFRSPSATKGPTHKEIHEVGIDEWFSRIGREGEFKLAPFASINALVQKAKASAEDQDVIIQNATEIIDDASGDGTLRWQCCHLLSGIGDKRGIPVLARALTDQNELLRAVAASVLGTFDDIEAKAAL